MNSSTKFDWHYVNLKKLRAACKQALNDPELAELDDLTSGKAEGAILLIPVLPCGGRDQSLHCMLMSWGKDKTHKTLDEVVQFVSVNFPTCSFYVILCDANKA